MNRARPEPEDEATEDVQAAVMNFALIVILGLAIRLSAQISNRTPVSLLNANASIQRATKGIRTSLGQSGRRGAYQVSKSAENTGNTTMADATVPVRIQEVQSKIPCDARRPLRSFASTGICYAVRSGRRLCGRILSWRVPCPRGLSLRRSGRPERGDGNRPDSRRAELLLRR
jgi:hypothetical protein